MFVLSEKFPGPRSLPIVGNLLSFIRKTPEGLSQIFEYEISHIISIHFTNNYSYK